MAVLSGAAMLIAPAASAQTGYPPPPCTPLDGTQYAGAFQIGETFTEALTPVCLFTPGADITVTVNGQSVTPPPKAAEANGSVNVTVFVESATSLLIDDPVRVSSRCGGNVIVATGPSQVARANVTQTATFDVLCPGAVPRAVQGRVAFTGANVTIMAAVALALVGIGAVLVVANRRRKAQPGS
ncbi:MAG: hypothetical protein H0T70_06035 [Acidimicrobiia bacterium]|nr:hypothetical protein [Acidimicrobiia bacterium]